MVLGKSFHLFPSLVKFAFEQSENIWGVASTPENTRQALGVMLPAVLVLHYLTFPPVFGPTEAAQPKDPMYLETKLKSLKNSLPFRDIQHFFNVTFERLINADVNEDLDASEAKEMDLLRGEAVALSVWNANLCTSSLD